jgi:hypothetical protein
MDSLGVLGRSCRNVFVVVDDANGASGDRLSEEVYLIEYIDPTQPYRRWWASRGFSYTLEVGRAKRFTKDEATMICHMANSCDELIERAWPEAEVLNGKAGRIVTVVRKEDDSNG